MGQRSIRGVRERQSLWFELIMQESRLVSANHKNEKEFQQWAEKTNKH